mgnify:CR=1 FL=1|jgi:hypothetical protein
MSYKLKINYDKNNQDKVNYNYKKAGVLLYSIKDNEKYVLLGKYRNSNYWNAIEIERNSLDGFNPLLTASRGFVWGTNNYGKSWNKSIKLTPIYHPIALKPPIGIVTPGILMQNPFGMSLIKDPSSWSNYKDTETHEWIYNGLKDNSKPIEITLDNEKIIYFEYLVNSFDEQLSIRFKNEFNSMSARFSDYSELKWVKLSDLKNLTNCDGINNLASLNNEFISRHLCHLIKKI